jgi:hypothetical protein
MENQEYLDNQGEFFGEATEETAAEPQTYAEAFSDMDTANTGASLTRAQSMPPVIGGNISNRAMRRMNDRAAEDAAYAKTGGLLTVELITNIGTLFNIGEQVARNAPGARKAIEHVINTYAASHAQGLAERWALWHRY